MNAFAGYPWLYFGCHQAAGHYLWQPGMHKIYRIGAESFDWVDGALCPRGPEVPYVAAFTRLGGWGYSAISFWDYTVDKRGKSNSNFLAASLTVEPNGMLKQSKVIFPEVWARLPEVCLQRQGWPA
jgi:hypothetical protein